MFFNDFWKLNLSGIYIYLRQYLIFWNVEILITTVSRMLSPPFNLRSRFHSGVGQGRTKIPWFCKNMVRWVFTFTQQLSFLREGLRVRHNRNFNFHPVRRFSRNYPNCSKLSTVLPAPLVLLSAFQVLNKTFPVLAPRADAALQSGSRQSRGEVQNPLPLPADHAALDAAQYTFGFLGSQCPLPAHVLPLIPQHSQDCLQDCLLFLTS